MNKNVSCLLYIFILLFTGCEYQVGDNFIDVEKPAGEIEMSVELTADNDGQKIVISEESTTIKYNLNTSGHKLVVCIFSMGEKQWIEKVASGVFVINKGEVPVGNYTLKCDIYVSSGSGSIADQTGMENYLGTYSWPVEVITYEEPAYSLTYKTNADGYLELSWEKPLLNESIFDYYRVIGSSLDVKITDRDQLSYICKSHIGQSTDYQVSVYFKNGRTPWLLGYANLPMQYPEITYDSSDPDSLQINIIRPYKSVMNIEYDRKLLVSEYAADFIRVPYAAFGASNPEMVVEVLPWDKADRVFGANIQKYESVQASSGILIAPEQNWARYGYNVQEDIMYVSSYGEITNWLWPDIIRYKEYKGPDGNNVNNYALSMYNSRMAAAHNQTIDVLESKEMQHVRTIKLENPYSFVGAMTFTKDDKLVCLVSSLNQTVLVYRMSDGALENSFEFSEYLNAYNASFSSDGRYLCCENSDRSGFTMVILENNRPVSMKKMDLSYSGLCMNPLNPEQLIVSTNGKIQVYNCRDLSLVHSLDYPGMLVSNVDPKTGFLLLRGSGNVKVVDMKTNTVLYTKEVSSFSECKLYGNVLLSNTGYALHIEKYLKK